MKKNLIMGFVVVFAFMAMTSFAVAGPGCSGEKSKASMAGCSKTCIKTCDIKGHEKTDGKLISAKADCDYKGKCETLSLNISGMTCGGCESSITTALMKQDGVIKVVSIDHKSGMATICFDPTKVESDNLAKLVTKKGYKAEIIAAVATSETGATNVSACGMTKKATETEKTDY